MSKKYCNVFKFISETDKKFAGIINDLCAESLFKPSKKVQRTFLYPNSKVLDNISGLIKKNQPEEAYKMLKSLMLNKCYNEVSDISKGTVPPMNLKGEIINDPKDLEKNIKKNTKCVLWEGRDNTCVFDYSSASPPSATKKERDISKS